MTLVVGIVILVIFFGAAVLYALLPGLVIGIPIGLVVQQRGWRFLSCLVASFAAGSAYVFSTGTLFLPVFWLGLCAALLLPTLLGGWVGGKLRKFGAEVRAEEELAKAKRLG